MVSNERTNNFYEKVFSASPRHKTSNASFIFNCRLLQSFPASIVALLKTNYRLTKQVSTDKMSNLKLMKREFAPSKKACSSAFGTMKVLSNG